MASAKDHIVRGLIWACIPAILWSNLLLEAMRRLQPDRVFPAQRMDAIFRDFTDWILWALVAERRQGELTLFALMIHEAADLNRNRLAEPRSGLFQRPPSTCDYELFAKLSHSILVFWLHSRVGTSVRLTHPAPQAARMRRRGARPGVPIPRR